MNFVTIAMCHLVLVHLNLADAISKSQMMLSVIKMFVK